MYSVGWLIVERESSRSRLLQVFEVPAGKRTNGFTPQPIPDGPQSIGLLTRLKTGSDLSPRRYRRALFVSPKAEEQSQAMANAKLSLDQAVEDAGKANSGYRADFREGQKRRKD
jgi:hypothetical protein